jgi:hypothetical protein
MDIYEIRTHCPMHANLLKLVNAELLTLSEMEPIRIHWIHSQSNIRMLRLWLNDDLTNWHQMTMTVITLDIIKNYINENNNKIMLLIKLSFFEFFGDYVILFRRYLPNKRHWVRVCGTLSLPSQITSGVSQGSVLESFVFNVFINDLCKH